VGLVVQTMGTSEVTLLQPGTQFRWTFTLCVLAIASVSRAVW